MTDALTFYTEKYTGYSARLKEIRRRQRAMVIGRLVMFGLTVLVPFAFAGLGLFPALVAFLLFLSGFLLLVKISVRLDRKGRYMASLIDINTRELEALRGNFSSLDDGSEFSDADHRYATDLDIFGPGSLFQYINRCCTGSGKEKLASMLLDPEKDDAATVERQQAFRELSENTGLCQHYIATGNQFREQSPDRIIVQNWAALPGRFPANRLLVFVSRALPLLTLASLASVIAGIVPFSLFVALFITQLVITGMLLKRINEVHAMVGRRLEILKKYGGLLEIIEQAEFRAPLLLNIRKRLETGGIYPSGKIKRLAGISSAFDNRLNVIAALFLNGLLLWDLNCVLLLERWKRKHQGLLPAWFEAVAWVDAAISFAVYAFNNPGFVFPEPVSGDGPVIYARDAGHPLISAQERVCNDFAIDREGRFMIITGANMAGKSTFLRTAGVAMVLAMAGAPVCASEFRFRHMEVYSSMRTSDSLTKHESYFYAELRRLKHLVDTIAGGRPVFVILDEILKGTNSTDKQKGSMAVMEQLLGMGATGIIATHDLSLTSLEQMYPGRISNKCFEIEIEGDRIRFDYVLRNGVTRKMNALLLMRQMGLISEHKLRQLTEGE